MGHGGLDRRQRFAGRDAERLRKLGDCCFDTAGALDPDDHCVALFDQVRDRRLEGLVGARRDRVGERASEAAVRCAGRFEQHLQAQALEEIALRKFLEHREARRDVCLERKLMQQPGAKRVDRLHFQTAGGLQRFREQPTAPGPDRRARPPAFQRGDRLIERFVVERDPLGESREHLVRHIGGGRFGEREAEDFRRRDAAEQEPDHAPRQHVRLAGARIGGDPGGRGRIGRLPLHLQHVLWDLQKNLAHEPFASPAATSDHSLTRARWS